jgi:hypothetical protein
MKKTVQIVNPLDYQDWNESISSLRNVSFFHTRNWAQTLYESYNFKLTYFALIKDEQIVALLPLMETPHRITRTKAVSLPFSDYCHPLFKKETYFYELLEQAALYGKQRQWSFIELRGGNLPNRYSRQQFYMHQIELKNDLENIFDAFRKSSRQNIIKAFKSGLTVKFVQDYASIREFYQLHCMNRRKLGVPPQPFRFFIRVFENIISQNHGNVILVMHKNRVISAGISFFFRETVIFKFVANDHNHLSLRPNNLMVWEMIKYYSGKGFHKLCFGKTEHYSHGLRQFKRGFGTEESNLHFYKINLKKMPNSDFLDCGWLDNHPTAMQNQSVSRPKYQYVLKLMPIHLVRLLGELFYRYSG